MTLFCDEEHFNVRVTSRSDIEAHIHHFDTYRHRSGRRPTNAGYRIRNNRGNYRDFIDVTPPILHSLDIYILYCPTLDTYLTFIKE